MLRAFRQIERALLLLGDAGLRNDNVNAPARMQCGLVTKALLAQTKLQAGAWQKAHHCSQKSRSSCLPPIKDHRWVLRFSKKAKMTCPDQSPASVRCTASRLALHPHAAVQDSKPNDTGLLPGRASRDASPPRSRTGRSCPQCSSPQRARHTGPTARTWRSPFRMVKAGASPPPLVQQGCSRM